MRSPFASLVAAALVAGCSSPAPDPARAPDSAGSQDDGGSGSVALPDLRILPATSHTGFDGVHTFQVPIAVYGAPNATLVASDPSAVDIVPAKLATSNGDDGVYFLVTAKRAGDVTLKAQAGGSSATASLAVASYTAASYATGEARYMNANGSDPACASCHASSSGIDHSPSTMASASDRDVVSVITTGVLVAGNPITEVRHKWSVTDDVAAGLVTYLRALPPRGFSP